MTRTSLEARKLLQWLGEMLGSADDVDVDVVVVGQPGSTSSVQITLRGVPRPLGGLEVSPGAGD